MPTIESWSLKAGNIQAPFGILGCGDAWCVVDSKQSLAWENTQNPLKALTDKETATMVADKWNDCFFSGAGKENTL